MHKRVKRTKNTPDKCAVQPKAIGSFFLQLGEFRELDMPNSGSPTLQPCLCPTVKVCDIQPKYASVQLSLDCVEPLCTKIILFFVLKPVF